MCVCDAGEVFPGLARLGFSMARRPELDLQLSLFGMLDILSLPGLSIIKSLIVDFLCQFMGPQASSFSVCVGFCVCKCLSVRCNL